MDDDEMDSSYNRYRSLSRYSRKGEKREPSEAQEEKSLGQQPAKLVKKTTDAGLQLYPYQEQVLALTGRVNGLIQERELELVLTGWVSGIVHEQARKMIRMAGWEATLQSLPLCAQSFVPKRDGRRRISPLREFAKTRSRRLSSHFGVRRPCIMSAGRHSDSDDSRATEEGFQLLKWAGGIVPQGALVQGAKGAWKATWLTFMKELAPQSKDGAYSRPGYSFTDAISSVPGTKYPVQAGRYHVYTGNACPWCHRVLLVLAIRGLRGDVGVGELQDNPEKATRGGWVFPGMKDPVSGCRDLYGVYNRAQPGFIGRCTAPCLIDTKTFKVVSNESSDIVRMLGSADFPGSNGVELYPEHLRSEIDSLNTLVYNKINNGVYKSGFATTQAAYDKAQKELYEGLDEMEQRLGKNRFLVGDRFTEADLRLYPTIIRPWPRGSPSGPTC
ncbi:hypothetical protein CYMTET_4461 [Cymbomonas tetramitiformis]|uniref:GST C-terminal domain-containing protein n=1 Tax=Cymbomonas tetramitiformis TaxID=36881 RepID=A0AAE0H2W6_9CHLO|nr:hypothetical protein CYMTET_4461 [Cymbomonas tetramitiformis]